MNPLTLQDLEPIREHLMERIERHSMPVTETGCVLWISGATENGYGLLSFNLDGRARTGTVHRLAYMLACGPIPEGLELDHKCNVRCCVNPLHLEPVTHLENKRRSAVRRNGAYRPRVTHCLRGHEYTPENTWQYRTRTTNGNVKNFRACRECARMRNSSLAAQWLESNWQSYAEMAKRRVRVAIEKAERFIDAMKAYEEYREEMRERLNRNRKAA